MAAEDPAFEEVAGLIRESDSILFITGAGISTDSGLPTYRGIGGLYENKVTDHGIPIEQALSATMMAREPAITWRYLWEIAEATRGARPNRSHEIIGQWVAEKPGSWVLTQNVDGLHAAINPHHLIEVHGRARNLYCTGCGVSEDGEKLLFESGKVQAPAVPVCQQCGDRLRPDVVLFEEFLSDRSLEQLGELENAGIELVFSIGTSSLFPYIAGPVHLASEFGIPCIEINPEETIISSLFDYRFDSGCTETLERLDTLARGTSQ